MRSVFFAILLFLCFNFKCFPQIYKSGGCVTIEPPKQRLIYQSLSLYGDNVTGPDSTEVQHFYKKEQDSIAVTKNNRLLSTFKVTNHSYITGAYKEYDVNGVLKAADSLYESGKGAVKRYFRRYTARHVRLSATFYPDGKPESILYFSSAGADSLFREWYASGIVKSLKRFKNDSSLSDDHYPHPGRIPFEILEYHANGRFAKKERLKRNYLAEYRETGVVSSVSYDTVISRQTITFVKKYYVNGGIKSMQYFQDNRPCCLWLEYSRTGTLMNSEQKAAIQRKPQYIAEAAAPEIFTYVEEQPEFRGGPEALKKYMEEKLDAMPLRYRDMLAGNYSLIVEVTGTGKVVFIELKGFAAGSIKEDLEKLVDAMPAWRSGKVQGRAISVSYAIFLSTGI